MANTLKFGNGLWATKEDSVLAYNDQNGNYKPLPFEFERDTNATVVNKSGLIETVGNGIPRIDFQGNNKGALLLEPESTNLITYSNDFSDSSWEASRGTIIDNATTSPDGTLNASKYEEDSQTGSHLFRRQSLSITNGLSYTGSIFVKKSELTSITLQSNSSSRWVALATFDLENGVVTSGTGVIENYGNGWYRCSISGDAVQTTSDAGLEMYTSVGVGRDGDGLFMYGAQFEQGSYPTSYIPTQGGTVTRSAGICEQTTPSGIIGQTEGTVYIYFLSVNDFDGNSGNLFEIKEDNDNRINIYFSNGTPRLFGIENSSSLFNQPLSLTTGSVCKLAIKYNSTSTKVFINGSLSHTLNGVNNIAFSDFKLVPNNNINYNDVKVYNTALSDSELQALTTI